MTAEYQAVKATGNLRWLNGVLQMEVIMADPFKNSDQYLDWKDVPVIKLKPDSELAGAGGIK